MIFLQKKSVICYQADSPTYVQIFFLENNLADPDQVQRHLPDEKCNHAENSNGVYNNPGPLILILKVI